MIKLVSEEHSFNERKSIAIVCNNDSETLTIWIDKDANLPLGMLISSKLNKRVFYEMVLIIRKALVVIQK